MAGKNYETPQTTTLVKENGNGYSRSVERARANRATARVRFGE